MNEHTKAIILKINDYREKDALALVLTKEYDILTMVLRGVNSVASKRKMALFPFKEVEYIIDYTSNKTMYQPKSMSVINHRQMIVLNPVLMSVASIMTEMAYKTNVESNFYDILNEGLNLINNENYLCVLAIYIKELLMNHGLLPEVRFCVNCQSSEVVNISLHQGGFVCKACNQEKCRYTIEQLKRFRAIALANYQHINKFNGDYQIKIDDVTILMNFYLYHFNIKINSWDVFKVIG